MNLKDYKNYWAFILSVILFLIMAILSLKTYLHHREPINNDEYEIEVNLPIMNWGKYTNLSKQYNNDIILED